MVGSPSVPRRDIKANTDFDLDRIVNTWTLNTGPFRLHSNILYFLQERLLKPEDVHGQPGGPAGDVGRPGELRQLPTAQSDRQLQRRPQWPRH